MKEVDICVPLTWWERFTSRLKALFSLKQNVFHPTVWDAVDNAPEGEESMWDKVLREQQLGIKE